MRGKYASRSESTAARDAAIDEAARLRREVERLGNESATERVRHADEVALLRTRMGELSALAADGSSEALEKSRARVRALEGELSTIRADLWSALMQAPELSASVSTWQALAATFGTAATPPHVSRYVRRMAKHNPGELREIQNRVKGIK